MEHFALTLTRPGQSRGDLEGVHKGRYDAPLTDLGRTQALALAQDWTQRSATFDAIICSRTGRPLGEALPVPGPAGS
ncbi:histidine phosphatase family protein [Deinococcus aquatilis]|uniref:histidine phosphatase family protein n=1 Tax=Deinococcus aquatilis TaxID=519440 RepID=UPI0009FDC0CA